MTIILPKEQRGILSLICVKVFRVSFLYAFNYRNAYLSRSEIPKYYIIFPLTNNNETVLFSLAFSLEFEVLLLNYLPYLFFRPPGDVLFVYFQ